MRPNLPDSFVRRALIPALLLWSTVLCGGCGGGRTITIRTIPADASIVIDGTPRPKAPVTERFSFGGGQFHTVLVTRPGYTDKTIMLDGASEQTEVVVTLKPRSRRVRFIVTPLPAIVKVDGNPVAENAVTQASTELEFAVDQGGGWIPHVVTAERPGYRRAEHIIRFTDADPVYTLLLESERKTVVIKTDPMGADVIVDGTNFGPSPVTLSDLVIPSDPITNSFLERQVTAIKPGYESASSKISWDEGKTDYLLKLGIRSKTIRVKTEPPDAVVRMGTKSLPHKAGVVEVPLEFAPLNASGEMPVYELSISPPAGDGSKSAMLKIGWDEGKVDYLVALASAGTVPLPPTTKAVVATPPATQPLAPSATRPDVTPPITPPVTSQPSSPPMTPRPAPVVGTQPAPSGPGLAMLKPSFRLDKNRWLVDADSRKTATVMETAEPDGRRPTLVARAAPGSTVDGIVTSPDGSVVAWTSMRLAGDALRSQLLAVPTAGNKPPIELTDGQAIDLMPSFSPDGLRVLFASDRISPGQLATYEVMIAAPGFAVRAAPGETTDTDTSPSLDSSPRPRLYVESRPTDGTPSRLIAIETVTGKRIDLGHAGSQPRISPRADAVVFVRGDPNTGKRDLWLLKLGEDAPVNLTNTPNDDDFDPAWSKTGSRIAYASDRAATGRTPGSAGDINLWALRVSRPSERTQITDNNARDDNPAWSGDDASLYFRSSRGGEWGIWRIELPK